MSLFKRTKNNSIPLIRQIIDLIPKKILHFSTLLFNSDKGCHKYKTYDQLTCLTFGQLTKCKSLTDISVGISPSETFLKDIGLSQIPARSTMGDGNKNRTYKVFENTYNQLVEHYAPILKKSYDSTLLKIVENKTIKIRDSSTISLALSLFNWAKFRTAKGGVKIHTEIDSLMDIPSLINITEAAVHDKNGFSKQVYSKGTIIIEDKGYFDFQTMLDRIKDENIFVTRIKDTTIYKSIRELELPALTDQNILKDEIIKLNGVKAQAIKLNEEELRRVVVYNEKTQTSIEILTNNLIWPASTIASLYKKRWDIEIFFKQLKQNLQVKTFYGTSENAVKSQIYVALIVYLLLQIINRVIAKKKAAFSNLCQLIRLCIAHYLTLDYLCQKINPVVCKKPPPKKTEDIFQQNQYLFH